MFGYVVRFLIAFSVVPGLQSTASRLHAAAARGLIELLLEILDADGTDVDEQVMPVPCLCPAYAMPVPCLCPACALPVPCLCPACVMPVPCLCHACVMPVPCL